MTSKKIITRTVLLLSAVSLMTDVASEMLYPVMPIYLKSIGFSVFLIGVLEGLAEATAGISKGYFGNLSDKMGRRVPFVQFGYGLGAVSKPLMALFTFPLWIFIARTIDRLGKGIRTSARDALLSDEATPETKGKVFGFHRGMDTLGAAIGPFLALIYLYFFPEQYRWLFVLAFIPGVLAIFITLLIKEKAKPAEENRTQKKSVSFFSFLTYWKSSTKEYKKLIVGLLAFTFFNSSDVLLLLMLKQQGASDQAMIVFYIFFNLIYAITSYPIGYLADKIGLQKTLIFGFSMFVVVYATISFTNNYIMFAVLFALYGLYYSATEGISKALISNISAKNETATAIGFYSSFQSILTMLASSFGGFLWYTFSPQHTFVFSAVGVAAVVVYLSVIFFGKH